MSSAVQVEVSDLQDLAGFLDDLAQDVDETPAIRGADAGRSTALVSRAISSVARDQSRAVGDVRDTAETLRGSILWFQIADVRTEDAFLGLAGSLG